MSDYDLKNIWSEYDYKIFGVYISKKSPEIATSISLTTAVKMATFTIEAARRTRRI